MKTNRFYKKSIAKNFIMMMGISIVSFMVAAFILWTALQYFKESYTNEIEILKNKEKIATEINQAFNQAFSDARGYYAYGNQSLKKSAIAQGKKLDKLSKDFEKLSSSKEDERFLAKVTLFSSYYFDDVLVEGIKNYEAGRLDEVANAANHQVTYRVKSFQTDSAEYINNARMQLDERFARFIKLQTYVQIGFIVFILLILVTLLLITRVMLRKVAHPLRQLALAANEIANGDDVPFRGLELNREDELGSLSIAFQKMVDKLQDKEQNLIAQNEELLAQQDELQAQQIDLEETLENLKTNEDKMQKRNEMINSISNSLDKQEVINSIVINMCHVISADCGIMMLLKEDYLASYGISKIGEQQFKENMMNGLHERLFKEKKPFIIKRELEKREIGYHEMKAYSYDLYLPVLDSNAVLLAIIVLSRFGEAFPKNQMDEYMAVTKNIAISLEKITHYEKSEGDRRLNQDILNTIQEGIQLIDSTGRIVQVNNQLLEMFPWHRENVVVVGLDWDKWTKTMAKEIDEQDAFIDFLQKAIEDKASENTFIYKMPKRGQVIKVYFEDLHHDTQKIGTVFVHRDITKEFEVDQMKSEFVSTVSHELRTPLASILGFTELMVNRELISDRQKKYLTTIYNEAKRLTALINDFLDVQRMEAGKLTYEKKFINLVPILEKVIDTQKINTNQHHLHFTNKSNGDIILGDRDKMYQVFTNLVNNAIKYSPNGGDIEITLYSDAGTLYIEFRDQGLGIPEESIGKLFTKFYRVDNSDRRKIGGTGLGLAIVQEIIKAHEGSISVQSDYGFGSTFTVALPHIPSNCELASIEQSANSSYHVMIIEDDQSLGKLIFQELQEINFQVSFFKSGLAALDSLKKDIPDAIVLDILLDDEVDGWKIIQEVKENELLKNIPIFISSALDEKEKGLSLGATDYLVKPYKPSQLSKTILQTLLRIGKRGQVYVPQEPFDEIKH